MQLLHIPFETPSASRARAALSHRRFGGFQSWLSLALLLAAALLAQQITSRAALGARWLFTLTKREPVEACARIKN